MAKIEYTLNKTGENNNIPPALKMMLESSLDNNELITIEGSKKEIRRVAHGEMKKLKRLINKKRSR